MRLLSDTADAEQKVLEPEPESQPSGESLVILKLAHWNHWEPPFPKSNICNITTTYNYNNHIFCMQKHILVHLTISLIKEAKGQICSEGKTFCNLAQPRSVVNEAFAAV